jgi:hypothetical protein
MQKRDLADRQAAKIVLQVMALIKGQRPVDWTIFLCGAAARFLKPSFSILLPPRK